MTSNRLRECLGALNWSTAALAVMAQVTPVTARRWLSGRVPIPPGVARVIEQMAALAEKLAHKARLNATAAQSFLEVRRTARNALDQGAPTCLTNQHREPFWPPLTFGCACRVGRAATGVTPISRR